MSSEREILEEVRDLLKQQIELSSEELELMKKQEARIAEQVEASLEMQRAHAKLYKRVVVLLVPAILLALVWLWWVAGRG